MSGFEAPILNKNGMLVGIICLPKVFSQYRMLISMCYSFEYHLPAKSILAIADAIERSQDIPFHGNDFTFLA